MENGWRTFKELDDEMIRRGFYSKKETFEDGGRRYRLIENGELTYYKEDETIEIIRYDFDTKDLKKYFESDFAKFEDIKVNVYDVWRIGGK